MTDIIARLILVVTTMFVEAFVGATFVLIALLTCITRTGKNSDWEAVERTSLENPNDGRYRYVMGRKVDGVWEYREMTPEERDSLLPDRYF